MSRGPGKVERQITELFGAAEADRVFTVADLCTHVFGGTPTRVQRLSVLRAAHRVLRRKRQSPLYRWRITERADRTLVFHDHAYPIRVWAVQMHPEGVMWSEAEIVSITKTRVNVLYGGERIWLDRSQLNYSVGRWRAVFFVSDRNGSSARFFEEQWRERYGHLFPDLAPLEDAQLLLGLPADYTHEDIMAAFRIAAKRCTRISGGLPSYSMHWSLHGTGYSRPSA